MDANKIRRLELSGFTCFSHIELDFSEGINVFIGENGVGKTHLMKVLYYAALSQEDPEYKSNAKLPNVYFGVDENQMLIRRKYGEDQDAIIRVLLVNKHNKGRWNELNIKRSKVNLVSQNLYRSDDNETTQPLYIPPAEMLSWYPGFLSLYKKREISFDKTYYDLAVALGLPKFKGASLEAAQSISDEISQAIKADVFQKDGKFYFRFNETETEFEASVVAQGINKLGQLYYLILNGSLNKDTILFWDEPESGLNPKYIRLVANILQTLANAGVQIFISTHDYLLAHQLSLMAEYRDTADAVVPNMKFFALYQSNEQDGTVAESGPTLADIQHNTILDEFSSFYDMEQGLFQQPVKQ